MLATLAIEAVVVGAWAGVRGVNADEGFYLAAGRNALEGRRIYADFFFPQMPYLPWLLAALFRPFGVSLEVGRAACVAAAALSAALLAFLSWQQQRRVAVTVMLSLLYIGSALLVNGMAIIKTAALANLLLLAAFAPLSTGLARHGAWAFVAGAAAGGAIGVRLPVAPVTLVFALLALRLGWRPLAWFAVGGIAASLPWLIALARHPEEFWFCTVTFHAVRREISGWPILLQKAGVLAKWLFLPQQALIWVLAGYGCWRAPREVWPSAACAIVLALAYLAATPTYLEYMTQVLPFLLVTALPALAVLAARPRLAAVVLAAYLIGLYPLARSAPRGSDIAAKRSLWSRATVDEVTAAIQRESAPGEPVLSWWEGYPVLSQRPGVLGVGFWESNVARKIDADAARRFHVLQRDELRAVIRRREPAAIVVADGVWTALRGEIESGYASAQRVGAVQIYRRRAEP